MIKRPLGAESTGRYGVPGSRVEAPEVRYG